MKRWVLYCHTHAGSGRRYVGLTSQTMEARWKTHVYKAKSSKDGRWHFPNAIRKYGPEAFSHEVLEVCHDLEVANLAEECWIEFYDTRNPARGFNLARGGAHTPHPVSSRKKALSLESRARISASQRGKVISPEQRALISVTAKARVTDEFRARCAENTRRAMTPECRAKIAEAIRNLDPSVKARIAESNRQRSVDPGFRSKLMAGIMSPENLARLSVSSNNMSVEHRAKLSASRKGKTLSPEIRAKIAASVSAYRQSMKSCKS